MSDISLKIQETFVAQESIMKRILFFLLTFLLVLSEAQAQLFNVYVKNPKGEPLEGVTVYAFFKKDQGKEAFNAGVKEYGNFDKKKYKPYAEETTDREGLVVISASVSGSIILDGGSCKNGTYDFKLYNIEDYYNEESGRNINLVLNEFKEAEDVTVMLEVPKTANPVMDSAGDGIGERPDRGHINIAGDVDILGEYARNNARFVFFPFVVYKDFEDSVVSIPPIVVEGKDYRRDMVRRTGFRPDRDLLNDFKFDASTNLHRHQSERILYEQTIRVDKGSNYQVPAILWYEDYNGVYHEDSILFFDGNETEPMRFLNWDSARELTPIDTSLFRKRGTVEEVKENKDFKLSFEQGKANLNFNDSITHAQCDSMVGWLNKYYASRDANITRITVRAYSSPEGSESRNRTLSRERANSIRQLLLGKFKGVKVEPQFDEYDNIVTWETIADSMVLMEDTLAKRYSEEIRAIVAVNHTLDKQYQAIRTKKDLYDYIDKNILNRVRLVSVEAAIEASVILTKAQIIERYNTEPSFVDKMMPYQYYAMMCYLADEERWDELYTVSKKAYEANSKERTLRKQVPLPPSKQASKDTVRLTYVDTNVPYPLAGYYYAVSGLRKGLVNTEILKPYLDDGPVGRRDADPLNSLPFIVAQVLTYCQNEDFFAANDLVKKYNLKKYPELEALIMFVSCLGGHWRSQDVRDYVMSTSEMNKAVILTALGKYQEALNILYSDEFSEPDAKVEYLKAICLFKMQPRRLTSVDNDGFKATALYDDLGDEENKSRIPAAWATPMLNAFRLDKINLEYIKKDGYFNNAYRQMIFYAWSRVQDGVPLSVIAQEYDALISKMRKSKEVKQSR